MSHKADAEFFKQKRHWSKRKDEILGCYLAPYLAKVMRLGKPILIVDGFAGPGKFADGENGSPLIIAETVRNTLAKNVASPQQVKLVCIEKNDELFASLTENLAQCNFAQAVQGSFGDFADSIAKVARRKTVFLYIDPFTVAGINWNELDAIFEALKEGSSVEILLNLNSVIFLRCALAALKTRLEGMDIDDGEPVDAEIDQPTTVAMLNSVAGGDWWQALIAERHPFPETVAKFTHQFCERLRNRFHEVAFHPIKEKPHHTCPKYVLVFGTRHIDGLLLMNDEMVKSRRELAEIAKPSEPVLFEKRSEELVPDLGRLPDMILDIAQTPTKRKLVIYQVVRQAFCDFHRKELRDAINFLLKSGQLKSDIGTKRINDDTIICSGQLD